MENELERYHYEQALNYLNHVKELNDRVNAKQDAIEDYRGKLTCIRGMNYSDVNVQAQSSGDAIPEGIAKLLDMIAECTSLIAEYADEQRRAMRVLAKLSRHEYEQLLEKHYLRGKDWGTVAKEMNYSYDHIMSMRRAAITEVYEFMPAEFKDPVHQAI